MGTNASRPGGHGGRGPLAQAAATQLPQGQPQPERIFDALQAASRGTHSQCTKGLASRRGVLAFGPPRRPSAGKIPAQIAHTRSATGQAGPTTAPASSSYVASAVHSFHEDEREREPQSPLSLAELCLRALCHYTRDWFDSNGRCRVNLGDMPPGAAAQLFDMARAHRLLCLDVLPAFAGCFIPHVRLAQFPGVSDGWLPWVARMEGLVTLDLSHCDGVSDIGLRGLAEHRPRLRTLRLECCTAVSDVGAALLVHVVAGTLRELVLSGCVRLTDVTLARVLQAARLERLGLSRCQLLSSAYLCQVGLLVRLRRLDLSQLPNVTDQVMRALRPCARRGAPLVMAAVERSLREGLDGPQASPADEEENMEEEGDEAMEGASDTDNSHDEQEARLQGPDEAAMTSDGSSEADVDAQAEAWVCASDAAELGLVGVTENVSASANGQPAEPRSVAGKPGGGAPARLRRILRPRKPHILRSRHASRAKSFHAAGPAPTDQCARGAAHSWNGGGSPWLGPRSGLAAFQQLYSRTRRSGLRDLDELDVSYCSVSDEGCLAIAKLTRLRVLNLSGNDGLTERAGPALQPLQELQELRLARCPRLRGGTAALFELPRLRALDLQYVSVSRLAIKTSLPALRELDLSNTAISDAALQVLAKHAPGLASLRLEACRVSAIGAASLATLRNLERLDLSDTGLEDAGVRRLAKLCKLRELDLFQCNAGERSLRLLCSALCHLERLNLDLGSMDDGLVRPLKNLRGLRHLDLFGARITDKGCMELARAELHSLESLSICGGFVTDCGVAHLASSKAQLRSLNLSQNQRITDAGVKHLAEAFGICLRSLALSGTGISRHAVTLFYSFVFLEKLIARGCGLPNIALHQLREALPNLRLVLS